MVYTIRRLDRESNIYMVLRKDAMEGNCYKKLPLEIHGFIRIEGVNYDSSYYSCSTISEELTMSGELNTLAHSAMIHFWEVD